MWSSMLKGKPSDARVPLAGLVEDYVPRKPLASRRQRCCGQPCGVMAHLDEQLTFALAVEVLCDSAAPAPD